MIQAALYARVSSAKQAKDATILSQLSELRARSIKDGCPVPSEFEFIDNGYSGSSLMRPGLENMRDAAAQRIIDRIYILSPDRFARQYAHQYILVEELSHLGIEIIFLNQSLADSPEGSLLLQVQGVIAEYERAKIIERNRRGKLHAAKSGKISVNSNAPYGYRYIKKNGKEPSQFIINLEEGKIIHQVFKWFGIEKISLNEATNRLSDMGVPTPTGLNSRWNRASLMRMLKNPAYMGQAAFGKSKQVPKQARMHLISRWREMGRRLEALELNAFCGMHRCLQTATHFTLKISLFSSSLTRPSSSCHSCA